MKKDNHIVKVLGKTMRAYGIWDEVTAYALVATKITIEIMQLL